MISVMSVNMPNRQCQCGRWNVKFGNDDKELVCDEKANNLMVVSTMIAGFEVRRILVDSGSTTEVLTW